MSLETLLLVDDIIIYCAGIKTASYNYHSYDISVLIVDSILWQYYNNSQQQHLNFTNDNVYIIMARLHTEGWILLA